MSLLEGFDFSALRQLLGELGADGWLLYDFHGINPSATRVLGIRGMGTRRFFVLLPREGKPVAVAHRIELASFEGFPGEVRPYAAWRELHEHLRALVAGKTVAMEVSPSDAVPYLDRVPHGVIQLIEGFGARVISSGTLITRFAARWSAGELAGHRRAAEALAQIAQDALRWAGSELARGAEVRETLVQARVMDAFARAGLVTDHPPIVGFQANAANPHYEPKAGADRRLAPGDVLLLDLWAGVALGTVFADQTWMGFAGREPSPDVGKVWEAVRGARDAAVTLLREKWKQRQPITGAALDDAARGVISRAGYGESFVHRTGHSIDRDLHGSGPHLD
ncbi:MAG: M24 family metallopeptidase, partial [Gemmatimonadota bacterium]